MLRQKDHLNQMPIATNSEKLDISLEDRTSELAKKIVFPFIGNFMSQTELSKIIDKSYSVFRRDNVVDFIKLGDRTVLELFHGPTLAFKDIVMQLLGNFY